MTEPITVVLVEDHSIFRAGLRESLGDDVDVVGEAPDVDSAVRVIGETRPQLVLLDVHLPGGRGGGGAEVIRRVAVEGGAAAASSAVEGEAGGPTRFLALSVSDSAEDVVRVIRAGARGYITKSSSAAEVSDAVRRVVGGDAVFSPHLAGFVLDAFGTATGETAQADDELDRLTRREQQVLRLIAQGYMYREIADELFISVKTVETHVSSVLRKLQMSSRHELTAWALSRRLL